MVASIDKAVEIEVVMIVKVVEPVVAMTDKVEVQEEEVMIDKVDMTGKIMQVEQDLKDEEEVVVMTTRILTTMLEDMTAKAEVMIGKVAVVMIDRAVLLTIDGMIVDLTGHQKTLYLRRGHASLTTLHQLLHLCLL